MADAAMASLPSSGRVAFGGLNGPNGGLAALKYAAQADMFQDDPNFYAWLEEWIGKQDEETVMIDAVNTLSDYGMQFEFQQQQQHAIRPTSSIDTAGPMDIAASGDPASAAATIAGAPTAPTTTSGASCPPTQPWLLAQSQPQRPLQQQRPGQVLLFQPHPHQLQLLALQSPEALRCGTSSSASLASHPSSLPSEDNSSLGITDSPGDSSFGGRSTSRGVLSPLLSPGAVTAATGAGGPGAGAAGSIGLTGGGWGPPSLSALSCPQVSTAPGIAAAHLLPGHGCFPGPTPAPGAGAGVGASIPTPFDTTSFTQPLGRELEAQGVLAELQNYLRRDTRGGGSPFLPDYNFSNPDDGNSAHVPSHGTVSSFMGTPPPPSVVPPTVAPLPAQQATALSPGSAGGGGLIGGGPSAAAVAASALSVPSLDQLMVRAICGNTGSSSDLGRVVGGGGGLLGVGLGTSGTRASAPGSLTGLTSGPGSGPGSAGPGSAVDLARGSSLLRKSSGSVWDEIMRHCDDDSMEGGGASGAREDCPSASRGGSGGGRSSHRHRRKDSFSGATHGSGHGLHSNHHRGIPVSRTLGHGHVGKVMAGANGTRGGGGAAGTGGGTAAAAAGGGGGGTGGRLTRSARAKAVFSALEAEVAGKMGELEALQREHASLTQRVEILEVAVERQNVMLSLLQAARAGASCAAAAAAGAPRTGGSTSTATSGTGNSGSGTRGALVNEAVSLMSAVSAALGGGGCGAPAGCIGANATLARAEAMRQGSSLSGVMAAVLPPPGPIGSSSGASAGARLSALEVLAAGPGSSAGAELLEWARRCTPESYTAWYKEHLQMLSMALLALEDSVPNPEAEAHLVQLVAAGWLRNTLTSVFQPLTMLRLKGLNLETNSYVEPTEQHWMEVIKFMTVAPEKIAEMENLFHSYTLLHGSFRAELQDTQRDLAELVERHDAAAAASKKLCSESGLELQMQQTALLKRVRSILQKTHLLYSCTIGVAAMRVLKPKEYAKCCVQSYPYYPCGPSLMKACAQFRVMKALWGVVGC